MLQYRNNANCSGKCLAFYCVRLKKSHIFAADKFLDMKDFALLIVFFLFIASCGSRPEPNQDLLLAYEFVQKGEFDTARTIAQNAPLVTEADSAMYSIVDGAYAAASPDFDYCDSCAIDKCIKFYDGDDEKSAWAHLIKSVIIYNFGSWYDAVEVAMKAESLADNTDCNELKFLIYDRLALLNIDSYNSDYYDKVIPLMQKYAVSGYNRAEYYHYKSFGYKLDRLENLDSAKYYAKLSVEYADNSHETYSEFYFFYALYAELMFSENDSIAEEYVRKALTIDTMRDMIALLGRIYLHRGELDSANKYFAQATQGRFNAETVEDVNNWLSDYCLQKRDFETAYRLAQNRIAAKDTIIHFLETNNIKPVQIGFKGELEKLKLQSLFEKRILLIILIAAVLLAVLVSALYYQKSKLAERGRKIAETQQTINSYNQKISKLQQSNSQTDQTEISFLRQKVSALEAKFSDIYTNGKNLYAQILADGRLGRWTKEDYRNFIDYYQSIDFLFVYGFETDYVSLTDRQKVFLILCHIGKTKEQIMQIMTLEESSFRSMKSRIEGMRK